MPAAQSVKWLGTVHQGHIDAWNETCTNPDWVWNNLDPEQDYQVPRHEDVKYLAWQLERGEEGTLHVQVYVQFKPNRKKTLAAIRTIMPGHWEMQRGSNEDCREYVRKEDTRVRGPWEWGQFTAGRGQRCDLEEVKAAIDGGADAKAIRASFPTQYSRHRNWVLDYLEDVRDAAVPKVTEFHGVDGVIAEWHTWITELPGKEVDPRKIFWVYDHVGNTGKSYLATYLKDVHDAFICTGGKGTDLLHAFRADPKGMVVVDLPRTGDVGDYCTLETFKNGIGFSGKYNSGLFRFPKPHVLVFANFQPDRTKYSADRIVLIDIFEGEWTPDSRARAVAVHPFN